MSSERLACACGVVVALVLPENAFAHVRGGAPVATNFEARIGGLTPPRNGIEAEVVDGDRQLWLRVAPDSEVAIPGAAGEPLLHFDRRGVFVNLRSVTAQSDRIDRLDLRPDPNPKARPLWHRLTAAHAYRWHEHRLHALEQLARGGRSGSVLGRWSVPLRIDGRRHALGGVLVYRRPPSAWPVVLAAVLGLGATVAVVRSPSMVVPVGLLAIVLVWVVRVGRGLYGRPNVETGAYVDLALTSLVGAGLVLGLLHREWRVRLGVAFLAAVGSLYEGWTMFPVLTHAVALSELPTSVARPAVATMLGFGAAIFATTLYGGKR